MNMLYVLKYIWLYFKSGTFKFFIQSYKKSRPYDSSRPFVYQVYIFSRTYGYLQPYVYQRDKSILEQKAVIQSTIGLNVRLNFTFLLENGFDFADKMFCLFEYSTIQSSSQLFQLKFCQNSYHSCLTSFFFCLDLSKILLAIYYNLFSPLFLLFSRLKWRTQCPVN